MKRPVGNPKAARAVTETVRPRLRSDFRVSALRRTAEADGLMAMIDRKGHEEAGIVFVKWVDGRKAWLFTETSTETGMAWRALSPKDGEDEPDVNRRLASEAEFDPDLWVVELSGPIAKLDRHLEPLTED
ncbi:MAG: DUF1491 family protein [Parvularcula sp.]|jgi:hypothetical protein|nr:DUF1491 family protein [Parvularcula sp.]